MIRSWLMDIIALGLYMYFIFLACSVLISTLNIAINAGNKLQFQNSIITIAVNKG